MVMVPALSRLRSEPLRYRAAFVQVFEGLAIAGFFVAGLLFPLANVVVRVILGDNWEAAGPIFAALTFAFVHLPLATATSWLYTSQGRGGHLLITACVAAAITIGAFVVGTPFGATGVAIAYSAASLLAILPLTFYMAGRTGPVATRDLWVGTISHLPVLLTVLAATWIAREWMVPTATPLLQLVLCGTVGTGVGIATIWGSARSRRAMQALLAQLSEFRANRAAAPEVEVGTCAS